MKVPTFDPGRISDLSVGVFAIAMTLLVLNLRLPDVGGSSDPSAFAAALIDQLPRFVSWLLSFAVLCRLWTVHHDLLAEGDTRTRGFAVWNFVFLGAVAFIPFPTSLLAEHADQLLSVVVFSATYVVAGIALGRMPVVRCCSSSRPRPVRVSWGWSIRGWSRPGRGHRVEVQDERPSRASKEAPRGVGPGRRRTEA